MDKVSIDDLPRETISDILGYLADNTSWGDFWDLRDELLDKVDGIHLPLKTVPLRSIRMGQWSISDAAVRKYAAMDADTSPPVLVIGNKLAEGGHRLRAAQIRGDKTIHVVDLANLLRLDWQTYLAGKPLPPALRESSQARKLIVQFIV